MLSTTPKPGNDVTAASAAESDLRSATRFPASAVPTITGLRISPHGVEAILVNISESGVLAECGERLKPGSAVTVVFEGTFVPRSIEGRVARNSVSSMGRDGRLRYHVGISFGRTIDLGIIPEPKPEPEPVPEAVPVPTASASASQAPEAPPALLAPAAAPVGLTEPPMVEFEVALPTEDETVRNRW
jgi:hypothetical protein